MAITLNDLTERLNFVLDDIEKSNYGDAAQRLTNAIGILENNGVVIHATASVKSKKVESNGRDGEEE